MKNRNMWMGVGLMALAVTALFMGTAGAATVPVTATFTADNYYGLFYQDVTSPDAPGALNFLGRNETGAAGSTGQYNWSVAEKWTANVPYTFALYVVAWDDETVARGIQGSVAFGAGLNKTTFYTGVSPAAPIVVNKVTSSGWKGYSTNHDNNGSGVLGVDGDGVTMTSLIGAANAAETNGTQWTDVTLATYSSWGNPVPGAAQANWIWYGNNGIGASANETVKVFRCVFTIAPDSPVVVPEPATLSLLGLGLAGLVVRRMRRKH